MVDENQTKLFQWMDQHEYRLCLTLNKYTSNQVTRSFFTVISRLGNGIFWYALMLLLPLIYGYQAITTSLLMALTGITGVAIYKLLKNNLVRHRPCLLYADIQQGTTMLDLYSFPSGHTLHSFSFSIIAINAFPQLAIILVPFAALVSVSRVVLGLHYPSDVLVGAALGSLLAISALNLII